MSKKVNQQKKLVGVFMPPQFISYLSALAYALGKTKSKVIRDCFTYWESNDPFALSEDEVITMIANKLKVKWAEQKAGIPKENQKEHFIHFLKSADESMTKKNISPSTINAIVSNIKDHEQKNN